MRFIAVGLMLYALIAPVSMVKAQDRALRWERYDIAVSLGVDGNLRVVETQHLVIDQGSFRTGSRSFTTGSFGRVRSVSVSEDGQAYARGSEQPGTFSASDDGERFQLAYVFRDPTATQHTMTIAYTVAQSLSLNGNDALLEWNFFCAEPACPRIDSGSLTLQAPASVDTTNLEATTAGAAVTASQTGNLWRWELNGPIQGQQVTLNARFPRSVLAPTAVFRSDGNAPQPSQRDAKPSFSDQLDSGITRQPGLGIPGQAIPVGSISPIFCVVGLFILIALFSMMGRSVRRRGGMGGSRSPGFPLPGMGMGGYGIPPRRRRFGGLGRGFGRGYGGWGVPPVIPPIIPPLPPSYGDQNPWDGPPRPDSNLGGDSGGGGSSWGDSGGGGSSWGDSAGGGASWGDSAGGGASWGDSGGGGSNSGGSGGRGGGGSNDSSGFN